MSALWHDEEVRMGDERMGMTFFRVERTHQGMGQQRPEAVLVNAEHRASLRIILDAPQPVIDHIEGLAGEQS
jgi:hypothetical protein